SSEVGAGVAERAMPRNRLGETIARTDFLRFQGLLRAAPESRIRPAGSLGDNISCCCKNPPRGTAIHAGSAVGLGSASSTRSGLRTAAARPGRCGAWTCFETSSISTPPARTEETRWPKRSHADAVLSQKRRDEGG